MRRKNLIIGVAFFFVMLLTLSNAFAQFPTTAILDNFNRSDETPVSTNWTNGVTGTGECDLVGNLLTGANSGTEDCYYNVSTFGANQEVFVSLPNATTHANDVNLRVFMCLQDGIGTATVDGYGFRYRKVTGASNDIIQMFKMTNAGFSNLGTAHTEEFSDGDQVGMSINGTTLTLYYRSGGTGSWVQVDQTTDSDHSCGSTNLGILLADPTHDADDFGGGNISSGNNNNLLGLSPIFFN